MRPCLSSAAGHANGECVMNKRLRKDIVVAVAILIGVVLVMTFIGLIT